MLTVSDSAMCSIVREPQDKFERDRNDLGAGDLSRCLFQRFVETFRDSILVVVTIRIWILVVEPVWSSRSFFEASEKKNGTEKKCLDDLDRDSSRRFESRSKASRYFFWLGVLQKVDQKKVLDDLDRDSI